MPEDDNHGFSRWVHTNLKELEKLGPGTHFGEWWGEGIQRGYGLKYKKFSLFNTYRWGDHSVRPTYCDIVPILYKGEFDTGAIEEMLRELKKNGSSAARGFMKPEGIVIFHAAANQLFKKTIEKDEDWYKK